MLTVLLKCNHYHSSLQSDAEKMYMVLKAASIERNCTPGLMQCGPCTDHTNSFKVLSSELETVKEERADFVDMDLVGRKKVRNLSWIDKTNFDF